MFVAAVVLFMAVLPIGSIALDAGDLLPLIGKWFVFWAIGVRLLTAGIRQVLRPGLTSEGLLGIPGESAWLLVRELGLANIGMGIAGVWSLWRFEWRLPVALVGGLFLLGAGLLHLRNPDRDADERLAMWSDLAIGGLMAVFFLAEV